MRKILICEDNVELSDLMRNYLINAGMTVYQAFDGLQSIEFVDKLSPDLVLLDLMLPELDGNSVCQKIRFDKNIPIIVVSAKDNMEDKEKLFQLGADDYITKPFSFKEMVMRVKAQLRRYYDFNNRVEEQSKFGNLSINKETGDVKVDGNILNLTQKEYKLLKVLTENVDQIVSKQKIIDYVWGYDEYLDDNTVAVTVARLREKLLRSGISNIVTVRGFGYKWFSKL